MKIFDKLFRRKDCGGRVSSIERYETSVRRPLHFLTEYGGSNPLGYNTDTEESKLAETEPVGLLKQAIDAGIIDEYSDLDLFFEITDEYYKKLDNNIKRQTISRKDVGEILVMQANQGMCIRKEKNDTLQAMVKVLTERMQQEECLTKELGESL